MSLDAETAPESGNPEAEGVLVRAVQQAPAAFDLTDPEHEAEAVALAESLLRVVPTVGELTRLELRHARAGIPVQVGLALKLAHSRLLALELPRAAHLSVVLAVYKETIRIRTREEHPDGEDFLRRKIAQLGWLFAGTPHTWELIVVDDGCPDGSGDVARKILEREGETRASVLHLADAIRDGAPPARGLASTDDSRKGGSIRYGLWHATRRGGDDHVALFTDADLSTHLGQCALLMHPILVGGARAAIGSRREPDSVVVKRGTRDQRGKLFIYLWKRLVPQLGDIVDTQCGFKAFAPPALERWLGDALESGFAFDIELLLRVALDTPGRTVKQGIAWIDSEALTTTADLQPYVGMLQAVAGFYRAYLPPDPESEPFALLVEALDRASFDRLLLGLPEAIADGEPAGFGGRATVPALELAGLAGLPAQVVDARRGT